MGDSFQCNVLDLSVGSNVDVMVVCPECERERVVKYADISKVGHTLCGGCASSNDITGTRFGRLVALRIDPEKGSRKSYWICKCDCGIIKSVNAYSMLIGETMSCGCYNKEVLRLRTGESSAVWKSTLTEEERELARNYPEYRQWLSGVYRRDNYTCQVCGKRSNGDINAHHLYGYSDYPKYRIDIENGVTLCESHHKEFHHWMGGYHVICTPKDFLTWVMTHKNVTIDLATRKRIQLLYERNA